jgi:hypothetical protein
MPPFGTIFSALQCPCVVDTFYWDGCLCSQSDVPYSQRYTLYVTTAGILAKDPGGWDDHLLCWEDATLPAADDSAAFTPTCGVGICCIVPEVRCRTALASCCDVPKPEGMHSFLLTSTASTFGEKDERQRTGPHAARVHVAVNRFVQMDEQPAGRPHVFPHSRLLYEMCRAGMAGKLPGQLGTPPAAAMIRDAAARSQPMDQLIAIKKQMDSGTLNDDELAARKKEILERI